MTQRSIPFSDFTIRNLLQNGSLWPIFSGLISPIRPLSDFESSQRAP